MFPLKSIAALGVLLMAAFLWIFYRQNQPYRSGPRQPIDFSHRVHVRRGLACDYCHQDVMRSNYAGLPSLLKCISCHREVIPYYPQVQILHAYWRKQRPIPWRRVYRLPDYVHFSHRPHIASGIACQTCHGNVGAMNRLRQVVNFNMSTCLTCHRAYGAKTDCFQTCHH